MAKYVGKFFMNANLRNLLRYAKYDPCARVEFCPNDVGRKCIHKVFTTCRNYMKLRNLTFKKSGRKC